MEDYSKYTIFILGAGFGTRLRPITNDVPKVMVPIYNNRPLLEHEILFFKGMGFKNFIINIHYLSKKIVDYFGDGSNFGVNILYSDESKKLMETAGALKKAKSFLSDDFILIYGDVLHFFDVRTLINFYKNKKMIAVIALTKSDNPSSGDVVEINLKTNKIISWYARPHGINKLKKNQFLNAGIYILSKDVIKNIPDNTPSKLDIDILPELVNLGADMYGFPIKEKILDIGTLEKYEFAKKWYKKNIKKSPFNEK